MQCSLLTLLLEYDGARHAPVIAASYLHAGSIAVNYTLKLPRFGHAKNPENDTIFLSNGSRFYDTDAEPVYRDIPVY
jgi:hypothetical protein